MLDKRDERGPVLAAELGSREERIPLGQSDQADLIFN